MRPDESSGSPAAPRGRSGTDAATSSSPPAPSAAPGEQQQPAETLGSHADINEPVAFPEDPFAADISSYYLEDGYLSDDTDGSDEGGGAPVVDYLDIANILTSDVDIDNGPIDHATAPHGLTGGEPDEQPSPYPSHFPPPETAMLVAPPFPMLGLDLLNPAGAPFLPPLNEVLPPHLTLPNPDDDAGPWFDVAHTAPLGSQNGNPLAPNNYGLVDFLTHWAAHSRCLHRAGRERKRFPLYSHINQLAEATVSSVKYQALEGDRFDLQGIDWEHLGVTRREARERRRLTYANYVNKERSDRWHPHMPDVLLPRTGDYFRFRRVDFRRDIHLAHFQLRNLLAVSSRSRVFYPGISTVQQLNPISGRARVAVDFDDNPMMQVSTIATGHGYLVAGGFTGEYLLRHVDSDERADEYHEGRITGHTSGITNHVQVQQSRTGGSPQAAFASNDRGLRVLDLATETFLSEELFDDALNCTALSPDRRLRAVVGDHTSVLITAADGGRGGRPHVLQELAGHRDFGFSCDWADDGWTVATGFQDKAVKIWDARRWTDSQGRAAPLCTLRTEMAGARSLKFSPVGSGRRVLVAAEEADFVNVVDAQSFGAKQTIDVFGEIGGVGFANDGQDLHVLCCDPSRGGLLQFERCDLGADTPQENGGMAVGHHHLRHGHHHYQHRQHEHQHQLRWKRGGSGSGSGSFDWPENLADPQRPIRAPADVDRRQKQRAAAAIPMEPF